MYGGDVTEFRGFWDRFADSIHKRTDLSDGTKLTHLHGCLIGDALKAISCLFSNGLYKVAVQRLKERFDRPYTAVRKLTIDLLRITTGEWTRRRLPDHVDCHINTLTEMGKDPRTAEFSLAELYAHEKLQSDLAAFQRFIREQAGLMAQSHRSIFKIGRNWKPGKASDSSKTKSTTRKGNRREVTRHASIAKGSHKASACPEVLKANSIPRRALDKKAGLCFSCPEPGHKAKGCGQRGGKKNISPAPLSGVKPPGPSQERDQKEGKQLRPVRVNLTSGDESGGTRRQIIRARAHSDASKKLEQLCKENVAAGRIEAQLVTTKEIYPPVDRLWLEYETGLDGEEAATAIAEWAEYRQLPKYGGDVTEFRGFWDRFADSIHKWTGLSDGTKLTYLHGCLIGDALRAISFLSSNGLYKVAVQRLKERFDRPYTAVRKLTLDLLRITTGEWTRGRLPDHIDCHIDTLTEMGKDPRTAEFSLVEFYVIAGKEKLAAATKLK
ncbi:hypothetical protein T08_1939 [Trichinella sp. T8]|nr:hypothetical protein T08_1939 [Trichinella sp. T8]